MLNKLRQIAIFSKTVEHGSFRKAAAALHLSPSVVSHHIAKLEEELGVALLYRSTRSLSLTSEGETLLVSAQAVIDAAEEFLSTATHEKAQLIGELTVSLPAVMARSALVNNIGDFAKLHPNVILQLDFSDTPRDIIRDGVDIAIRMGFLTDSNLKATKLLDVERSAVASANYIKSKPNRITLEEVETWDWIELSQIGLNNIFVFPEGSKQTFKPKSSLRVNSAFAMQEFVLNDNGVAVLPTYLTEQEVANGNLVYVLPEFDIRKIGVYAVWPPNAPKGGLTNRFVEHLKEHTQD